MDNDLISRSELKKDFIKEFYTALGQGEDSFDVIGTMTKVIDNAPTVERPQGEWIAREDMDYLDENKVVHKHFECNKCGLVHDFIDGHTSQYNFCPNCGAEMKQD